MFTRVVEITTKPGKARELCSTVNEKVLPILKKQPGFVDEITLVSESEPDTVLAISFWKTQQDAENYQREQFAKVNDIVRPTLESEPDIRTFEVDTATNYKITRGKAA